TVLIAFLVARVVSAQPPGRIPITGQVASGAAVGVPVSGEKGMEARPSSPPHFKSSPNVRSESADQHSFVGQTEMRSTAARSSSTMNGLENSASTPISSKDSRISRVRYAETTIIL